MFDVLNKVEKVGCRASKGKSKFFMNSRKWLRHETDENEIKPNEEKVDVNLKLKPPESTKELKSFLGILQYMTKLLPKISERTDRLRKLLNIINHGHGETNNKSENGKIKQMLKEESYLAHNAEDEDNIKTSVASTTGFGITQ